MSVQELDPGAFVVLLLKSSFACVTSMVAVIRMDTLILCYYLNIGKHIGFMGGKASLQHELLHPYFYCSRTACNYN